MYCYRGYSLIIGSELPLPELPEVEGNPDIVLRLGSVSRIARKASVSDELAFHKLAGAFHIKNGHEIVIDPLPGADPDAIRAVLIGRMMAYLLRQRGWLSLHASGVVIGGVGVLFLGNSGSGKSTAAAAFHARGHNVMTDDVAPVRVSDGRCIALPVSSCLRLDENSRPIVEGESAVPHWDKYRVDVTRGTMPESIEVKRIYVLVDGPGIGTREVPLAASVRVLSAHSFFRRRRMDETSLRSHLRDCATVASTTSIRQLTRPRLLSMLSDVVRFVERDAGKNE